LKNEVTPLFGPKAILRIAAYNLCDVSQFISGYADLIWAGGDVEHWKVAAPLELEVQAFMPRPNREFQHIDEDIGPSEVAVSSAEKELQYYAIPEASLPSLELLENWALETTRYNKRALVGGFKGNFLSLARRYCESSKELPLVRYSFLCPFVC
jgi:hypothetical protein